MDIRVFPGKINGTVQANASKSVMQRACAAALLHKGVSVISNPGNSNDDTAALGIIERLGAKITPLEGNRIRIESPGFPQPVNAPEITEVDCGESGLSIRMFSPIAALSAYPVRMTGGGSLSSRPLGQVADMLKPLGVRVETKNGKLPIEIQGPLKSKQLILDGSLSSQFLTGLLMAFAGLENGETEIKVTNLTSRPYIDLTLDVLRSFGLAVPANRAYENFLFPAKSQKQVGMVHYEVEADWSGAAFLLVAGAIGGQITVNGLKLDSFQGDKKILEALHTAGANIEITGNAISVEKNQLKGFHFDATDCPDLFPPLVALAAQCDGQSVISGVKRLKHKESDRGQTLKEEFEKTGCRILPDGDQMTITPSQTTVSKEMVFHSHHDHRIAMAVALSIAASGHSGVILHADAIKKSYPGFFAHLQQLGIQSAILNETL